jgi:hypothetical protein
MHRTSDLFNQRSVVMKSAIADVSFWDRAPSASVPAIASIGRVVPLIEDSVHGAAWLPVDQAVRVSACEAHLHNLSGSLAADIGDEIAPSRRVRQHRDLVVRQSVQFCIRIWRLAVVSWVEPGRLRTLRGFVFHVVPSSSAAKSRRMLTPIGALVALTVWPWFFPRLRSCCQRSVGVI